MLFKLGKTSHLVPIWTKETIGWPLRYVHFYFFLVFWDTLTTVYLKLSDSSSSPYLVTP